MADEPYRDANRIWPILESYSWGSVFDLDSWTAAARSQHNNSVLIAVPVSSRPAGDSATTGFELGAELSVDAGAIGMFVGGAMLAVGTAVSSIRRFRERDKVVGKRNVNDRVAVLFYPDRVDLHARSRLRRKIAKLHVSFPLEEVSRVYPQRLNIAGTTWMIDASANGSFDKALDAAGIELQRLD